MRTMKILAPVIGILLLALPAFGQSIDVEAQIASLRAQIKQLQALIAQLQGQSGSSPACISLSYNLYADQTDAMTNGEVSKLQQFLAQDSSVYPSGFVTGYFGPMTEAAVQRWQAAHGIVSSGSADTTGYGYVGPKTRAALACGGIPSSNQPPVVPLPVTNSTTPACSIVATPNPASFGQTVTLTWTSQNAVSAQWQSDTSGKDNIAVPSNTPGTSGAAYVIANVLGNPYITLKVFAANGTSNMCTATFGVPSQYPSIDGHANSYATIDSGSLTTSSQNPTITGTANMNGVAVQIYDSYNVIVSGNGFVPVVNGRWSVTIPQTLQPGVYKVEVLGAPIPTNATLTIVAQSPPTPTVNFQTSPNSILVGQVATLSWSSSNANRCYLQSNSIYEPWQETVAVNGSKTVMPNQTTSYRLICTNDPGTGKDGPSTEKTITVNLTNPTHVFNGSGVQINSGPNAAAYLAAVNVVPGSSFTMSGTASVNGPLTVVLVEIKYAGGTDWNSVGNLVKDGNGYLAVSNSASISGGGWSAAFGGLPEGYYHILIYDASYNLKGSGFLVSTWKG
ncbi:peptidoglycan-binding protein [Candidatus Kaiserbacteria bacterium]|nr:peptidoglycan-binding protein [Candidatus Kaiserbacteria bacterium]